MRIEFLSTEDDGRNFIVHRRITDDAGFMHDGVHIFPHDTLEWRAAEYGIDPSEVDTLMDIVLAEPYLTPEDFQGQPHLYDGESTEEQARAAHISRCAKVKLAHRISTRGRAADPLQLARENHPMDTEALSIKRELVARGREHQRQAHPEKDRVAQLRAALEHERHSR